MDAKRLVPHKLVPPAILEQVTGWKVAFKPSLTDIERPGYLLNSNPGLNYTEANNAIIAYIHYAAKNEGIKTQLDTAWAAWIETLPWLKAINYKYARDSKFPPDFERFKNHCQLVRESWKMPAGSITMTDSKNAKHKRCFLRWLSSFLQYFEIRTNTKNAGSWYRNSPGKEKMRRFYTGVRLAFMVLTRYRLNTIENNTRWRGYYMQPIIGQALVQTRGKSDTIAKKRELLDVRRALIHQPRDFYTMAKSAGLIALTYPRGQYPLVIDLTSDDS